ncbi:GNAT family N-acetyltransferase [Paenibacillus allorhizosphaerae]|uniref:N-acetyltransferase domain-containing protein n=1 Tax=Paenibacillus allorhizosphaerae TaxID=2849866 RepID=A0ABN7THV8_9BACL|nr:GNAT family N-acetyltransferase [Paenibacillus allorhizosphaerae]CAG7629396.1 hypothetical protein PAECIP111802_01550 [Paenibacillus allorhizosphaerae]
MQIRKAALSDAAAIAKVHIDSWKTTYRGIVPDAYLDTLSYEDRKKRWEANLKADQHVFVAENEEGAIVGFASGGKERSGHPLYSGELYALYILQAYQRQGIGKKLVREIMNAVSQRGFQSMLIWVLEDNPAKYFYESMGGKEIMKQTLEIGGARLTEIAYGWEHLAIGTKPQE